MKSLPRLLLAGMLLAPVALCGAAFEGKVSFSMTSGRDKPLPISYSIKGDKLRIEMSGQKDMGGMIIDSGKKEMIMIMDSEKMYMTMAIPDAAVESAKQKGEDMKVEKTGETEKILGYTATKYIATDKNGTTDMWLAEGLGAFMSFNQSSPMGGKKAAPQAWERALAGKDLFPLRIVSKDKAAKENFRMETTAIEKTKLSDSLFTPPADYQKFDMGGMGGMMKGLLQGFGK